MNVSQAMQSRRSIRRFTREPVSREALEAMCEAARLAPTGVNRQPLRFAVITGDALCAKVFPLTRWAGLIPGGAAGPDASTQPTAYIAILVDKTVTQSADTDAGAAGMSILLAAEELGIASCWLGSVDRAELLSLLSLSPEQYAVHTLVALGHPAMRSYAVPAEGGETAYYLQDADTLCVPKRAAKDVVRWFE